MNVTKNDMAAPVIADCLEVRGAEFIDDAVRDGESMNREIEDFGFAFARLADMAIVGSLDAGRPGSRVFAVPF